MQPQPLSDGGEETLECVLFRAPCLFGCEVGVSQLHTVDAPTLASAGSHFLRRLRFFHQACDGDGGEPEWVSDEVQSEVLVRYAGDRGEVEAAMHSAADEGGAAVAALLRAGVVLPPPLGPVCLGYHRAFLACLHTAVGAWHAATATATATAATPAASTTAATVAGVAAVPVGDSSGGSPPATAPSIADLSGRALVVGVGVGAFVSALLASTSLVVVGVEVDAGVLALAREFFGLPRPGDRLSLVVQDGMDYLRVTSLKHAHGSIRVCV
jgi:hypothetical protein